MTGGTHHEQTLMRRSTLTLLEKLFYCDRLGHPRPDSPPAEGLMSDYPEGLRYTEEHEYLKALDEEGVYQVGITHYAQGELGDIVYVELPEVGASFKRMATFGTIEAVKAVSDLYCPAEGEVTAVNQAIDDDPSLVNSDPYGNGWMIHLRVADPAFVDSLMDAASYQAMVDE
jgi:glycine cleavage system H protein